MKLLLLNLPDFGRSAKGYSIPLGLAYLGSVLEENGYEVKALDLAYSKDACKKNYLKINKIALKSIKNIDPDIICISCLTFNRFNVKFWSDLIKKELPNTKIFLGGPHATFEFVDTLKNIKSVDIVVRGEGEGTIVELCKNFRDGKISNLKKVKGISYRRGDKIYNNVQRSFIEDLDSINFPSRHLFPMKNYDVMLPAFENLRIGTAITSRGCPIGCKFCSTSYFWGKRYRFRSAKNVVDEIEEIFNSYPFLRGIIFFDDSMTVNKKRLIEICDEIIKRKFDFKWACWSRVTEMNSEIIKKMKKSGCSSISFGIESGSQKMINYIGKKIDVSLAERIIKLCKEVGIRPRATFMFGLYKETDQDMTKTIKLITKLKLHPDDLIINYYTMLFPNTPWTRIMIDKNFSWMNPQQTYDAYKDPYDNILVPLIHLEKYKKEKIQKIIKRKVLFYSIFEYPEWIFKAIMRNDYNSMIKKVKFLIKGN